MFQILYSVYFAAYSEGDIPKYFLTHIAATRYVTP